MSYSLFFFPIYMTSTVRIAHQRKKGPVAHIYIVYLKSANRRFCVLWRSPGALHHKSLIWLLCVLAGLCHIRRRVLTVTLTFSACSIYIYSLKVHVSLYRNLSYIVYTIYTLCFAF